jgi:hypothetical protein
MKAPALVPLALLSFIAPLALASSVPIVSSGISDNNTGVTFDGLIDYDEATGVLTITLNNTSPLNSSATGLAFNIAGTPDVTVAYDDTDNPATAGVLENEFTLESPLNFAPFGEFEYGLSSGNVAPNNSQGVNPGETGIFTFALSGPDTAALSALSFISALSTLPPGDQPSLFGVRFQSVGENFEGSDRATGVPIPLPPGAWAGLATLGAMALVQLRRKLA